MAKTLDNAKKSTHFAKIAVKNGCVLKEGKKHTGVYKGGVRITTLPRHPKDLPKGTRFSIKKALALIIMVFGSLFWVGALVSIGWTP